MTYKRDNNDTIQSIPGGIGLKFGIVRKFSSINSFCLHTLIEPNVDNGDPKPGYETRNRRHVGEPDENFARIFFDNHET